MKKYDYDNLASDEHVFHMWEPLDFEIDDEYKYIKNDFLFKFVSKIVLFIIRPILVFLNKVLFGYKIVNKDKIVSKMGVVSISNHIHPMDCTMIGLIYFPYNVYYPTIERNFKMPFIRHLIRILGAFPIPSDKDKKKEFFCEVNMALKSNEHVHMYPEGSMWPYYTGIREFKYGAFKMAVDADSFVQPIRFVFEESKGLVRLFRKMNISAVILDPLYPNKELNYYDRIEDLRNRTYKAMKEVL